MIQRFFWRTLFCITPFGNLVSRQSEDFEAWLSDRSFCFINSLDRTHVTTSGNCSLIDISLRSYDIFSLFVPHVTDVLFESGHFLISISFDYQPTLQRSLAHCRWTNIFQEVNFALSTTIAYAIFSETVQRAMTKNCFHTAPPRCYTA